MKEMREKHSNQETGRMVYFDEARQATWLELFFDLVFVAVIGVIIHDLAHTHEGHISPEQLFRFFLVFVPIWWVWATHTMFADRYDSNNTLQKLFTLALMALVIILSPAIEDSLGEGFIYFLIPYLLMRFLLAIAYLVVCKNAVAKTGPAHRMATAILVGAGISSIGLFIESDLRFVFLYGGIATDMIIQAIPNEKSRAFPVHKKHLAERIGLLAIIILGEAIISIVASFSEIEWDSMDFIAAITGFLLIGACWWIYYATIHLLERAKRLDSGLVLLYCNLIFSVGLIFIANMVRHSILGDMDRQTFALLSIAGLTMFYVGKQIPYMVAFPPYRFGVVVNSLICIAITVASSFLPKVEYSMIGMTIGMIVYVQLNIHWMLKRNNIDEYLSDE